MYDTGRNLLNLLHQEPGKKLLGLLKGSTTSDDSRSQSASYRRMTNEPYSLVPPGVCANISLPGADIRYMSRLFNEHESLEFFDSLQHHREVKSWRRMGYGREVAQWSDPPGLTYSFSEGSYMADHFPDFVMAIKNRVETVLRPIFGDSAIFNYCVCNFYANGRSGVFWHADDEPELCEDCPIACVSFGSERVFSLISQATTTNQPPLDIRLQNGSLFVMAGMTQKRYLHSIQKEASITDPRFSLTFRLHKVS